MQKGSHVPNEKLEDTIVLFNCRKLILGIQQQQKEYTYYNEFICGFLNHRKSRYDILDILTTNTSTNYRFGLSPKYQFNSRHFSLKRLYQVRKLAVMYLTVKGIYFAYFYDFSTIRFWNCSDSVVFLFCSSFSQVLKSFQSIS